MPNLGQARNFTPMVRSEDRELVPLMPGFEVVWHGFDRTQVKHYLEDLEKELAILTADRDAAMSQVADLTEQLASAHSRISELGKHITHLTEVPPSIDDLDHRGKRMVQLAQHQANEIIARAQAAASHSWAGAEEAAANLRAGYEQLLSELSKQHQEMRIQHEETVEQARTQVAEMTLGATKRRHELDAQDEARRAQLEDDFDRATASKRYAVAKEIERERATARAEAERLVREASAEALQRTNDANNKAERKLRETTEDCHRRVQDATKRVQELQNLRIGIIDQLQSADVLVRDAAPLLEPLATEQATIDTYGQSRTSPNPASRPLP